MNIGVNLLYVRPSIGGGWNYIQNLLEAISKYDTSNKYTAFVNPKSRPIVPSSENFDTVCFNINPENKLQRFYSESIKLNTRSRRNNIDCMFWFGNVRLPTSSVPGLVVVHDLRAFSDPKSYSQLRGVYMRTMMKCTASQSDATIIPVSSATADHVSQYLGVPKSDQVVVPIVIPQHFHPRDSQSVDHFRAKYNLPDKFWLYVSHTYTHKNHIRLIKAYKKLRKSSNVNWPLVLRGDPKDNESEVQSLISSLSDDIDIIRLPRLEGSEMPLLYSAATVLVFPSKFEGGGIPVIEAMSCECPVIASKLPVIQEFAEDSPLYVDPSSVSSIYESMYRLSSDSQLRQQMSKMGKKRARKFSGSHVVQKLKKLYSKIDISR